MNSTLRVVVGFLVAFAGCGESFSRGAELEVQILPPSAVFGSVAVGETAETTVHIIHTGRTGTLELEPATLEATSDDLSITGPEPLNLEPGESAAITITYRPSDGEWDTGTIVVDHNMDEREPLTIAVDTVQQIPQLTATPWRADFGSVSVGTEHDRTVRITNDGWLGDTVTAIGLDSPWGGAFTLVDPPVFPIALGIGDFFEVTVRYTPPITGSDAEHTANLRLITTHDATNNRVVPVVGTAKHDMLRHTPAVVDFGWVSVGANRTEDVVISNVGTEPVTLETVSLDPEVDQPPLNLLGLGPLPTTLQPGETLTLTVRFGPDAPITTPTGRLAVLRVVSDDYLVAVREIPVLGHAGVPALVFDPEEVSDFGVVAVLHEHARRVRAINQGPVPLTITAVDIAEDSADGFRVRQTPPLPVTLAPGGSAVLELGYENPGLNDGVVWGRVAVTSDDPVNPSATHNLRVRNAAFPTCIPRLTPPVVNFGTLGAGSQVERELLLANDGSLPCVYTATAFLDCQLPFGLCQPSAGLSTVFSLGSDPPAPGRQLFFGDALTIPVRYSPEIETGEDAGIPIITLENGIGTGSFQQHHTPAGGVSPALHGVVGTAGVIARPTQITWDLTTIGCASPTTTVEVHRLGPQPIELASITPVGCDGEFEILGAPSLPVPLYQEAAQSPVTLQLRYVPTLKGPKQCTVELHPDVDGAGSATVSLGAAAAETPLRTEVFQQESQLAVDILFVVDSSGSMGDEQDALAQGFDGFIDQAAAWDVDYQVGIVTTDLGDEGRLVGGIVDQSNTSSFEGYALVGTDGSGDERGLRTAWLALQPDMLKDYTTACTSDFTCDGLFPGSVCVNGGCGGANRGFLRDEALLAIIWISDEEEHSCDVPVTDYVDFFETLKGKGNVRGYAIVGDPKTDESPLGGCGGGGHECDACDECPFFGGPGGPEKGAEAGSRYIAAAEALGGFWSSICGFGSPGQPDLLEQIGKDAFTPVSTFPLSDLPVGDTLTVTVDGGACSEWTWNPEENIIHFDDTSVCFPGPGAEIVVSYEVACIPP